MPANSWQVILATDDGGLPGEILYDEVLEADMSYTGVTLFGVQEWLIEVTLPEPNPILEAGTYHVSVIQDSVDDPDSWFWEVADEDTSPPTVNGSTFGFVCPPEWPNRDGTNDFALEILEGRIGAPPNDCNENGVPDDCDALCDLDLDGDVDEADYGLFVQCFGTRDGDELYNPCCDCDCTSAVGMGDYACWLECYRDFIGDPLAPPPGPPPGTPRPKLSPSGSLGTTPTLSPAAAERWTK
jgi:hypothetical protein